MKRRELLAAAAGTTAAGAAVWPLAAAVVEPLHTADAEPPWVDVGAERELPLGLPIRAELRVPIRDGYFTILSDAGSVWLRRLPGHELLAFSAACPHLGCGVGYSKGAFVCPCHESRFSLDGAYARGPAPRDLDPLPLRVENGRVFVQAVRFAPGTKARRPL